MIAEAATSFDEHAALPTVRDVLSLAAVQAGDPELIAGAAGLERPVRWAHVVAGRGAVALLDGGELVLTTGAGWPTDSAGLTALAEELVASGDATGSSGSGAESDGAGAGSGGTGPGSGGAAAVVLELGATFDVPPEELRLACAASDTPLIVLRREVRFVQITQHVHQQILAAQNVALQAREEVHAMLTELGLNRSPVDYVVERLAMTLGAPVVLEDPAHQVIAWASGGPDALESEQVLGDWLSAGQHVNTLPKGWVRVPVEARGTRWGQLTALPGDPHPAGRRTVLELGVFALALARLADPNDEQWLQFRSKRLFDVLLGGRYRHDTELSTQLTAGGLPIDGRMLVGATLTGTGDFGSHVSLEHAVLETALRRAVAPDGRVIIADDPAAPGNRPLMLALCSFAEGDPRVGPAASPGSAPPLAARLARELEMLLPSTTPASWRAHLSLGVPGRRVRSLITSIERVRAAGHLPPDAETGRVAVQHAERQPLAYLVRGLSSSPDVQEFAAETLGPLIAHDGGVGPGHSGDLLRVLDAYLTHPTNRSLAAQRSRLSRSVFYQRLTLIEDLLGVDLNDGMSIATLTVALLARGVRDDPSGIRSESQGRGREE